MTTPFSTRTLDSKLKGAPMGRLLVLEKNTLPNCMEDDMPGLFIRKAADVSVGIPVTSLMAKALNTSRLVRKQVTVNRGGKTFQQYKWMKPGEAGTPTPGGPKTDPEEARGSKHGYGMHRIENGDEITFKSNGVVVRGTVVDDECHDGVVVKDSEGRTHPVEWKDITGYKGRRRGKDGGGGKGGGGDGGGNGDDPDSDKPDPRKSYIEPGTFHADSWAAQFDDPTITGKSILEKIEGKNPGTIEAIEKTEKRLENLEQTIGGFRVSGKDAEAVYTKERQRLHDKILGTILSPKTVVGAMPSPGEKPVFIMLGGRGGSGKSWFEGKVYDPAKVIKLDADEIKGMLPEYEGWNAAQIHEESSDILEKVLVEAKKNGLNVVLDATMKTEKSALKKIDYFKDAGYSVEAHYMHLPRIGAAERAVMRFMGKTKRYVPVDVVLANTTNEATFDKVRQLADTWSFRDNDVSMGQEPILISNQGKGRFGAFLKALLYKSMARAIYSKRRMSMAKMPSPQERPDIYDEYDNGDVTPDEKLAPDVKAGIERVGAIVENAKKKRAAESSK